jgi:hypothetical protein
MGRPIDIRTVPREEHWKLFEKQWTSLLSYRYIGRVNDELDVDKAGVGRMRLRHDMRNTAGGVMVAPLCIFAPEAGGMNDNRQVPNPVIQSVQILDDARGVKNLRSEPETIRLGRTTGFSRTRIVDADNPDRVISISEGMCVTIGDVPPNFAPVDNPLIEVQDSPDLPPLHQVFGATRSPEGVWRLPELRQEIASPDAALHLGPQHVVIEAAATEAASVAAGTDRVQIESYHCMFVARGKVGPFRAATETFGGQDGKIGVRISLVDEGNGGRTVTSATAVFHRAP